LPSVNKKGILIRYIRHKLEAVMAPLLNYQDELPSSLSLEFIPNDGSGKMRFDSPTSLGLHHQNEEEHPPSSSVAPITSFSKDALENGNKSCVQVAVRIRPLLGKEGKNNSCVHAPPGEDKDDLSQQQHDSALPATSSSTIYQTVQIGEVGSDTKNFTFDHVFSPSTSQFGLYSKCVYPLVRSCLEGYNATILAYGQTCSGKTHTIIGDTELQTLTGGGDKKDRVVVEVKENTGVIPRALRDIFLGLEKTKEGYHQTGSKSNPNISSPETKECDDEVAQINKCQPPLALIPSKPPFEYQVKVQFLELYGELIQDLIKTEISIPKSDHRLKRNASMKSIASSVHSYDKKSPRLVIRDGKAGDDAEVIGICQAKVNSAEEALLYLQRGMDMRCTESTAMNAASSRSHAIFTLVIQQTRRDVATVAAADDDDDGTNPRSELVEMKTSKIHFVDLAGSERIKSAKTKGKRMQEGISINKGLLVLGNVISALGSNNALKRKHVPYRDSKLTRLLKGSLGGNHKTLMIACVSPSTSNIEESRNTLRYANRAKNITNHAKVNVDPSSRVVKELKYQVAALARELMRVRNRDSSHEEEDGCPFSMDFLGGLIHSTDVSPDGWKSRRKISSPESKAKKLPSPERPATSSTITTKNSTNPPIEEEETKEQAQEEQSASSVKETETEEDSYDSGKIGKSVDDVIREGERIISYDFLVAALRETLKLSATGNNKTSMRNMAPGLDKVRTVDEIYDYLQAPTVQEEVETASLDDSKAVIHNHVERLERSINSRENLIKEMKEQQEKYQTMALTGEKELFEIDTKLETFEKEEVESAIKLHKESLNSSALPRILTEKEKEITKLHEERRKILGLFKTVDENARKIRNMKRKVIAMKRQRLELKGGNKSKNKTLDSDIQSHASGRSRESNLKEKCVSLSKRDNEDSNLGKHSSSSSGSSGENLKTTSSHQQGAEINALSSNTSTHLDEKKLRPVSAKEKLISRKKTFNYSLDGLDHSRKQEKMHKKALENKFKTLNTRDSISSKKKPKVLSHNNYEIVGKSPRMERRQESIDASVPQILNLNQNYSITSNISDQPLYASDIFRIANNTMGLKSRDNIEGGNEPSRKRCNSLLTAETGFRPIPDSHCNSNVIKIRQYDDDDDCCGSIFLMDSLRGKDNLSLSPVQFPPDILERLSDCEPIFEDKYENVIHVKSDEDCCGSYYFQNLINEIFGRKEAVTWQWDRP